MKRVHYSISKNEAIRFFYCQALAGDPTDGIPGCYKIAMARAEKIINPLVGDELSLWTAVLNEYALSQNKSGCPYALMDFHDVALETARLVKLQEYPNQLWNPPGVPDERTN
jgi:hypothetical protein